MSEHRWMPTVKTHIKTGFQCSVLHTDIASIFVTAFDRKRRFGDWYEDVSFVPMTDIELDHLFRNKMNWVTGKQKIITGCYMENIKKKQSGSKNTMVFENSFHFRLTAVVFFPPATALWFDKHRLFIAVISAQSHV